MPERDDFLLSEFTARRSERAFGALVGQHVHLVFATALRQVGDAGAAEEITQDVFVALAQSAGKLKSHPTIAGWLHQTALNKSCEWVRSELRRRKRERVSVDLSLARAEGESVWSPLIPLLDEALLELRELDRLAVILHFMEGRTFREVGSTLGVGEDAARKRVKCCLDQLTQFFRRHGFAVPSMAVGAPIFTLSSHAAPAGLAASASAAGLASAHLAASGSTLTLIKGAFKIMAWTKAKTAIVTGAILLVLGTATTTVLVKRSYDRRMYSWRVPKFDSVNNNLLWSAPPQVRILPTKFSAFGGAACYETDDSNLATCMGICASADIIVEDAYLTWPPRVVFLDNPPKGQYDFIANLRHGAAKALQEAVKRKFSLVGKKKMWATDVLVLKFSQPETQAFKPANSLKQRMNITDPNVHAKDFRTKDKALGTAWFNQTFAETGLLKSLEEHFGIPIVDETGLTNRCDFSFVWPHNDTAHNQILKMALLHQLGLELVPTNMPVEMLVVEKSR